MTKATIRSLSASVAPGAIVPGYPEYSGYATLSPSPPPPRSILTIHWQVTVCNSAYSGYPRKIPTSSSTSSSRSTTGNICTWARPPS
eukprot:1105570-Rhodomonas_salina.1